MDAVAEASPLLSAGGSYICTRREWHPCSGLGTRKFTRDIVVLIITAEVRAYLIEVVTIGGEANVNVGDDIGLVTAFIIWELFDFRNRKLNSDCDALETFSKSILLNSDLKNVNIFRQQLL